MSAESNPGSSSTLSAMLPDKAVKPMHVQHIWIVTGPAGCGKSTVGNGLRKELGLPFLEGDDVRQIYGCTRAHTHTARHLKEKRIRGSIS